MAFKTKMTPGETLCVRIGGTRTFIKPEIAEGGDGRLLTMVVDAPAEVAIERQPKRGEARFWPDQGVMNANVQAKKSAAEKAKLARKLAGGESGPSKQDVKDPDPDTEGGVDPAKNLETGQDAKDTAKA